MSDYDSSGQDALSSDSEESFEEENDLGSQLQDLSGNSYRQSGGNQQRSSINEAKKLVPDLEDPGPAPLHKDREKRQMQLYGAHLKGGSYAENQLRNTFTTSDGSVVLAGASYSLPGTSTSILQPNLGVAEHSTVESSDKSVERPAAEACAIVELIEGKEPELLERKKQLLREQRARRQRKEREERELLEAECWQSQQGGITASSQWLCEHYQRHCSVKFPCCMQFYSCHHCHNISTACDNEEAKACHATHLKCSYCQHEQEICEAGARCQKCSREMSAFFCSICKHFTSLDENPYHCKECGICWIHKDKSFHRGVCNMCLDKWLGGNHKCRPDSSRDEFCICLEDAFIGCQILPCSHKGHRGSTNVAATQSGIEEDSHGLCLCERCTSSREDQGVSSEDQHILNAPLQSLNSHSGYSDEGCVEREDNPRNHVEDLLDNSRLQTISLDGSSLVEKTPIPELENPGEALFLTDKEKHFMQPHGAHLQEASGLVERVLQEREEHEQFGREIERTEQLTGEQRAREEEEIKERELGCTHREGASDALTQNGSEEDSHGLCLCERCTSSREDQGVSSENQHILYAPLQSLNSHSGYSDEGCVEREDNPRNHVEDLLDNSRLQTISLDGSSLVEKTPIPELENPGEALFLTDKEKCFMQSHGAHLQEASGLVERVLQEREEHEQFGREIERTEQLTGEQRAREEEEIKERELGCTHREGASDALTQNGSEEDSHGLCLCERCTSSREDQGVSSENQHILYAPLQSLNSHSGYSDEGCVEREDNPRNHVEDLLDNSRLQTISLDRSSLVEKTPIPELENPGEALFLTDKEKCFMQSHGAHLQEASGLVERVLQEREEHEQFGREIERTEQLTGEQRAREEEEIKERELGCTHREGASDALTQNGSEEDSHGLCLCERCTSSREDQGVSSENQHILYAPLQSLNSHSGYSDEGCVEREDNPRNHVEDLLDNSRLQTISLDGSSLVEKTPIPELENPGEALFLTDKEKCFMQSHGAHLQEASGLVERVLQEREEHEQFGREIERTEQLTGEQRAREEEEIKERELGCTQREGASDALTQNGIEYHNHGLCLCKRCTLSREDEDKEVSPALPMFADSSSSTQSQGTTDDNCAQSQTSSTDAALETLSGLKSASMSANSQIAPEADSIYDKESQHTLYAPFPEGIAPSFLARHTQDKDLNERAPLEMSLPNDIPSHRMSSSNLGPVTDFVFGSQRANPYFGDDDTNLQGSLGSFLSLWSSGQHERQGVDEGSWAGAVRPQLGFPFHGAVGGAFNDPLAQRNAAFNEDCSTRVLEVEAGFEDDIFVQSPADGAIPQQAFTSANSQSHQFWNRTGARPRETQGRRFSVTSDWVSPVARAQQPIEDESLLFVGGREGTEEDFEDGITIACLLRHSQDEALCTWALHEHVLIVEEVEQLRRRIEWKEKLIEEKRACKEEEEEKELQEMTCNVQVHTAHKVPVQVCINCNEIIDAQHQESHPCHHHPDICCICREYLDDFIGWTEVPCGHKFHEECYINMLLNNIETCPLCRRPF